MTFLLFATIAFIFVFTVDYLLIGRELQKTNRPAFYRGLNYYGIVAIVILVLSLLKNIL